MDFFDQYPMLLIPKIYENDPSVEDKGFCYIASPPHFVFSNIYKIGKTGNIADRLSMLSTAHPESFDCFMLIKTNSKKYCEKDLLKMFKDKNIGHEFYELFDEDFDLIRDRFKKQIIIDEPEGKPYQEMWKEFNNRRGMK